MLSLFRKVHQQYPLISSGWILLVISLFLPAFSSEKGIIFGLHAAIVGFVFSLEHLIINIFVIKALILPIEDKNEVFVEAGWKYLLWFLIYLSITISAICNLLFLASPFFIFKIINKKAHRYYTSILWFAVACSLMSSLYVILGFHEFRFGFAVWVMSFISIALGFQGFNFKKAFNR